MGQAPSSPLTRLAGCLLLGLLLLNSFRIDWRHVSEGGSVDLRNRITGARLMSAGIDPFRYKWKPGEPAEYCDPYNNPAVAISKTTITPTFLLLKLPFAQFPYGLSPLMWLLCQWLLLLGTGLLWLRACPNEREKWIWACLFVGFTYTVSWRLHADRGQGYVLPTFLIAAWISSLRKPSAHSAKLAGLWVALLISIRPHYIVLFAPLFAWRYRDQILPAIVGLGICGLVPMMLDASCWADYQSGMSEWSHVYRNGINPRPPPTPFPAMIEGVPIDQLGRFAVIPFADSSVFALFRSYGWSGMPETPALLVFVLLSALTFGLMRNKSEESQLLALVAWSFAADFFLPALRNCYNDVLILNVMALALIGGKTTRIISFILLISVPLGWWVLGSMPRERWLINLPTLMMLAASALCLFPHSTSRVWRSNP